MAGQPPERLALLLPLTGKLANAAEAIRDGVLAAYYDSPAASNQPELQIYDSGETPEDAVAAYQQAVADGAEFVIGPLRKEAVQALANQPQLAVPLLALNQIEDQTLFNPSLYQFGLAPEDEAREVARLAWHEGFTRSIALLPNTEWGERVYAAFAAEWQQLGGVILEEERYDASRTDHGKILSGVLNLDSSKARQQQLSRHLGNPTTLSFSYICIPDCILQTGTPDTSTTEILPGVFTTRVHHLKGIQRDPGCRQGRRHERYHLLRHAVDT